MRSPFRQAWALGAATTRELLWGLRAVSREIKHWRTLAYSIPDVELRQAALGALACKRGNINGAALFWVLPPHRSQRLLRLLVAYDHMADYLDTVSEGGAHAGIGNGRQLHCALIEALDPAGWISDYYLYNPAQEDGGYLRALVECCRDGCTTLPSFSRVRPFLTRAASLTQVLGINHEPDPQQRDTMLKQWAETEFPTETGLYWFELAAGASAWITILALLALGAEPERDDRHIASVDAVYLRWIAPSTTMLDSYVDMVEDATTVDHNYFAHYQSLDIATQRTCYLIRQAINKVRDLPEGAKHTVIVTCMVTLFLSKNSARTPATCKTTHALLDAGGPLARLLLPVLRAWRTAYAQRAT